MLRPVDRIDRSSVSIVSRVSESDVRIYESTRMERGIDDALTDQLEEVRCLAAVKCAQRLG